MARLLLQRLTFTDEAIKRANTTTCAAANGKAEATFSPSRGETLTRLNASASLMDSDWTVSRRAGSGPTLNVEAKRLLLLFHVFFFFNRHWPLLLETLINCLSTQLISSIRYLCIWEKRRQHNVRITWTDKVKYARYYFNICCFLYNFCIFVCIGENEHFSPMQTSFVSYKNNLNFFLLLLL